MIHNAAFRRKVIYLGLIALLLIPLYVVGHPAVGDAFDTDSSPGGRLAQLRTQHDLSPSRIGEVDPTSESMKLATLGMRGVAASILWSKAHEYRKKENWEGLVATVNQMAMLQPNFLSVWEFQSHNLTYNISAEQDDYRFRYLWVKRGIEFLVRGTHFNRREPKLLRLVGWYLGQKVNRADEHKQFRRLFKTDQDFHESQNRYVDIDGRGRGADGKPDSWLVSRLWYQKASDVADTEGLHSLRGTSPHIFHQDGAKALMNYVIAIEEEGIFDERAENGWKVANDAWDQFGNRAIGTTNGLMIRLNDKERQGTEHQKLLREFEQLAPGVREEIRLEKFAKLSQRERDAMNLPAGDVADASLFHLRLGASYKTFVSHKEVAGRAPESIRARAFRIAQQLENAEAQVEWIQRYRDNINFDYWRARCRVEQLRDAVTARRHIFNATQLPGKGDLDGARTEYELAWDLWAKIIDENPILIEQLADDDLLNHVVKYQELLVQLDQRLPADFKLRKLLEKYDRLPPELAAGKTQDSNAPPAGKGSASEGIDPGTLEKQGAKSGDRAKDAVPADPSAKAQPDK